MNVAVFNFWQMAIEDEEMREIPRMFQTEMVCAILEKRKNQTRRLDGLEVLNENPNDWFFKDSHFHEIKNGRITGKFIFVKPHYEIGNIIWIKETYRFDDFDSSKVIYKADIPEDVLREIKGIAKWKSSMFMPKALSRIRLQITDFCFQRLQGISEADAKAEGVQTSKSLNMLAKFYKAEDFVYRVAFQSLWDKINGKKFSWEFNPWVNVVTFKILEIKQ